MGSQNLIEPGYNKPKNHKAGREWVELIVRVEGPVVAALNVVFATDWYSETGEMLDDTMDSTPRVEARAGGRARRARWSRAARASPRRTTCGCSPR